MGAKCLATETFDEGRRARSSHRRRGVRRRGVPLRIGNEMNAHPTIDETIAFAAVKHSGQSDKNGIPYIAHPLAVMRRVPSKAWHVACLHDVIEDCDVKIEDLAAMGYAPEELTALVALTHRHGEAYDDFIDRIINEGPPSGIAVIVKIADIDDNLEPWRNTSDSEEDMRRRSKYRTARLRLGAALGKFTERLT